MLPDKIYRSIFARAAVSVIVFNSTETKLLDANMSAEWLFGCQLEELKEKRVDELFLEQTEATEKVGSLPFYTAEKKLIRSDGTILWVLMTSFRIREEADEYIVSMLDDISARKSAELHLDYVSTHDALTGLYNRAYFDSEYYRLSFVGKLPVSMILIDVDGLKQVNDSLGHKAGDALIRGMAEILKRAFHENEIVCRLGGDEFAILLHEVNEQDAEQKIRILEQERLKYSETDSSLEVQYSFGVATAKIATETKNLYPAADQKMYENKEAKKTLRMVQK